MAFTFGFYNSLNGDRRYDAIQMSSIFDGIIRDGIFMSIGDSMMVKASSGMMVTVGIGRAWFDHTWSLNDALLPVTLGQSEILTDRIDLIILEVNSNPAFRTNSIKVLKGTPSANPVRPTPTRSLTLNQYVLADIRVNRGVTVINQANITNRVGTGDTPFITGILQTINIDNLVAQWGDQWRQFYNTQSALMVSKTEAFILAWQQFYDERTLDMTNASNSWKAQWETFFNTQTTDIMNQNIFWRNQWKMWFETETTNATLEWTNWLSLREGEFDSWWSKLQVILDGNVAANLAKEILNIQTDFKRLTKEFKAYHDLEDSDNGLILDDDGNEILGCILFIIK